MRHIPAGWVYDPVLTEFVAVSRPLKMRWANYISTFMVDWFSINSLLAFYLIWNLSA